MSNFDHEVAGERRTFSDRSTDSSMVWKIAAGVAVGSIVAALVLSAIERYRVQVAVDEGLRALQQITRGANESAARARGERERQEAAKAAREQDARLQIAEQQRAADEARRDAIAAAARKERAWVKFYKKPANCEGDPNSEQMVQCANHFIRAKRQFEEAYAAGNL
jgi:hypothetical protein